MPSDDEKRPASLAQLATDARAIFERTLKHSLGHANTQNTCLHGSILLLQSVQQFGQVTWAAIYGGGGAPRQEGLLGADGQWHGHYWVQGVDGDGQPFVTDITADQFGLPPIILDRPGGPHFYRYRPDQENPVFATSASDAMDTLERHDAGLDGRHQNGS